MSLLSPLSLNLESVASFGRYPLELYLKKLGFISLTEEIGSGSKWS